jgi:DNA invertase Pin-like site-specific DNA recombinase
VPLENIPVAQYVRMSTDDQQYSIANQNAKIQEYADRHGFRICRTYADPGKSGVVLKHRKGLSELLADVISGQADFKAVLVYDVSRWGRFQNPDEAAHYEYLCQEAGVTIHYCAEQFVNDGSLPSSIMKALKRTMAGEYSRELGVRVYEGKKRLTELGFRQGGTELYGLRRMVVDRNGRRKHLLEAGEQKSILTDRVILVHGTPSQVKVVREIFEMASIKKKSLKMIAASLNERKVKSLSGRPWVKNTVYKILKNPAYMGCAVWGRSSKRLHGAVKVIPRARWIIKKEAFTPVVDEATFEAAQRAIEGRSNRPPKSDQEIISKLKRVLAREGKLNTSIINRVRGLLKPRVLYNRFGSFLRLYELVGHVPPDEMLKGYMNRQRAWMLRKNLFQELVTVFGGAAKVVQLSKYRRRVLEIGPERFVSIYLCRRFLSKAGNDRWLLCLSPEEVNNVALICCLDTKHETVLSYYLIPALGPQTWHQKTLRQNDPWFGRGVKIDQLSDIYQRLGNDCHVVF